MDLKKNFSVCSQIFSENIIHSYMQWCSHIDSSFDFALSLLHPMTQTGPQRSSGDTEKELQHRQQKLKEILRISQFTQILIMFEHISTTQWIYSKCMETYIHFISEQLQKHQAVSAVETKQLIVLHLVQKLNWYDCGFINRRHCLPATSKLMTAKHVWV